MEVFTDVDSGSFRTGPPKFRRPTGTERHFEWCIAVPSKWGPVLTGVYSVMVTLLFALCWEIVSIAVISLSDSLDRGSASNDEILRGMSLVGFWNAREPLGATRFMLGYLYRLWREGCRIHRSTRWLLGLALVWFLGTYAAGIWVAAALISGKVAPANPNQVYVPPPPGTDPADIMRLQALRAPATLRSLGSAEAASTQHTIRKRFSFDPYPPTGHLQYFTYNYNVTAHDMGLQMWYDLKQEVGGRCDLNSSWLSNNAPNEDLDVYRPWGLENATATVVSDGERKTAPSATALSFPYKEPNFLTDQAANHRYGIIVHSSHRASYRVGTDPWYKTESFTRSENDTDARLKSPPGNRVMRGRPALSCTQTDVWSYNGKQFKNIYELTSEANIKFPDGWATQLQLDFAGPRIVDVINSAGPSSLVSSSTFAGAMFDAETSTIEKDMTRLFTATWISTAHTFRNMLMVGDDRQNFRNAAETGTGQPQRGVELFVVSTPKVATLRLSVLVIIPTLLAFFTLLLGYLEFWLRQKGWHKKIHFAEGAYLFARTQDSVVFKEAEGLGKDVVKCNARRNPSGSSSGAIPQANGGSTAIGGRPAMQENPHH